jgi:uncharacterized protein (DUF1501 family)
MIARRSLLAGLGSGLVLAAAGASASFAASGPAGAGGSAGRFVLVILRGALDGLAAVPPLDDPAYRRLRGALALPEPGAAGGALPLTGGFGLHPSLPGLSRHWQADSLVIQHATATPYRDRSHFDGQDMLESGTGALFSRTGWLGRALAQMPGRTGLGISRTVPLVLRGAPGSGSWAPGVADSADEGTLARLMDLYQGDALLGPALARAVATERVADEAAMMSADGDPDAMMARTARRGQAPGAAWAGLASAAAGLMAAPDGPAAAVLSFDGWDTHANQGAEQGLLAGRLGALDRALGALETGLGPLWGSTAVVVATEFGRTVRVNGTGGTDHGTGGVGFALGGAFAGRGGLMGDWPGLARLHEDRDLIPANDLRDLFALGLNRAFGFDPGELRRTVFGV